MTAVFTIAPKFKRQPTVSANPLEQITFPRWHQRKFRIVYSLFIVYTTLYHPFQMGLKWVYHISICCDCNPCVWGPTAACHRPPPKVARCQLLPPLRTLTRSLMDLSAVPCLTNDGGFLVKFLGLFMLDHVDSQDADFEAEVHWKCRKGALHSWLVHICAAAGKAAIW